MPEESEAKKQGDLLTRVTQVYIPNQGNVQVSEAEALGKAHFTVYCDLEGREVSRHDFDVDGALSRVTLTQYNKDGQVELQEHYEAHMKFYRERDSAEGLQEFEPDGACIRNLE